MKRLIPVLFILPLLFSACSLFKAPKVERVQDVQLKDLTPAQTNLSLSVVISNPNWFAITVKSLDVEVMDKTRDRIGKINMTQPLKLEKHVADTVYLEISADTRKVASLLSHTSQKVEFIVRPVVVAKVFGITKKVTLEQPQDVNFTKILEDILPTIPSTIVIPTIHTPGLTTKGKKSKLVVQDPKLIKTTTSPTKPDIFKVVKTSITDIGLKETELTVKFLLLNPYGVSFTFKDFPAEIWIDGKYAGKGKLSKPILFDENVFSAESELVFNLNNFNTVLLASKALLKKDMGYKVDGTLMIEGFGTKINKPFTFQGRVEIGKKDK